jgi:hypothetical protein
MDRLKRIRAMRPLSSEWEAALYEVLSAMRLSFGDPGPDSVGWVKGALAECKENQDVCETLILDIRKLVAAKNREILAKKREIEAVTDEARVREEYRKLQYRHQRDDYVKTLVSPLVREQMVLEEEMFALQQALESCLLIYRGIDRAVSEIRLLWKVIEGQIKMADFSGLEKEITARDVGLIDGLDDEFEGLFDGLK